MVGKVGDSLTSYFQLTRPFRGHDQRHRRARPPARTRDDAGHARQARGQSCIWPETEDQRPRQHQRGAGRATLRSKRASQTTLTLADGSVHACHTIDASMSGVAVFAEVRPPVGTPLG